MKNVAVLVSGGGTNLQALIDAQNDGRIKNGKINLVVSSKPDAYALVRAEKDNIKTAVVNRSEHKNRESFSAAIAQELDKNGIDLIVFAGFNYILSPGFAEKFSGRMINVHPALIPSFCGKGFYGLYTHEAVINSGVKLTGATVHFVTAEADSGPIISQRAVEVLFDDTPEILQKRVMERAEWTLLPEAVELFCSDKLVIEGNRVRVL